MRDLAILQRMAMGKLRVQFSPDAMHSMVELGNECVSVNPKDRPTAAQVLYKLQSFSNVPQVAMDSSEHALRRSKREHQPSAKAAASLYPSTAAVATSSARRSQRRRVTRSASPASTPASTRNSSPVRGVTASPASSDLVAVVVDAVGPNGQRRRLRAAAHSGANSSVIQGVHDDGKVLGRYSSRDCALLCEVIMSQLKTQTLAPTVLEQDKSPAFIRWGAVAKKLETTHKVRVAPRDCQLLWKFLAYGQTPSTVQTDELLPDSDSEEFHKTPKEINAQLAETTEGQVTAAEARKSSEDTEKQDAGQDNGHAAGTQTEENESSVRLYPTYSLPTGAPDAWYRPFGPKDTLPLTFVASRFLRRKANPPPMHFMYAKSTTTAGAPADLKRKQTAPAVSAVASKKQKVASVSTPPRVFTPSSTPPPAAKRARSELEFFEARLRGELAKKTPESTFELSAADIQRRFGEASAEIRHECQVSAAHDVERFNREVVRVRIWQKAMGANSIKPKPTLAPATASASKPVPAIATKTPAPAATQSSGPSAALLAHAAAVGAIAAKAKNAASASATSSTPTTVQNEKDGGSSASAKSEAK
ncbi:hypothetical protein KRP22_006602 [Phytophthora ramorum]|nr:hypothetical protein KRP22_2269 [Phytophthora ramorum]